MKIYTAFITLKSGQRIYASQYNKEAFVFEVTEEDNKRYHEEKEKPRKKKLAHK